MAETRDTAPRGFCTRDSRLDLLRELAATPVAAPAEPEPAAAPARVLGRYVRRVSRST